MLIECEVSDEQMWKLYEQFSDEQKDSIIKAVVYDDLIKKVGKMLTEIDYDWYGWDTTGWRSGSEIRESIARIQGIEPEWKKDYDSKIRVLSSERENYKKYYDRMFELYHSGIITYDNLPK